MTDPLVLIDPSGEILFTNKATLTYQELFHTPISQGQSIFNILPEDQRDYRKFVIREVMETRVPQTFEAVFKHPQGHTIFFEMNYTPLVGRDDKVEKICIIAREITSQKTLEKKTSQLIKELSNLIESANAVIFGIDAQGYLTEWNNECSRVTGFDKHEVLARKINTIFNDGNAVNLQGVINTVLAGESVGNCEFSIQTKNSTDLIILLSGTPKISAAGKVVGALFVGQDITELSEYRRSLEQKVKDRTLQLREALQKEKELVELKNKFVSIASHEFKIPLNAISSSVNALKQNLPGNAKDLEKLDTIAVHVGRMKGLLEDVLAAGKNQVIKLKPNYQSIDLVAFLYRTMDEVSGATSYSHAFEVDFSHEFMMMQGDEKLLRNIFVNLLSNAIKFSPGKGKVGLSARLTQENIDVTIRDYGIGISPEDSKRVFEPFNRGSNTGEIKGTGLGLSIVKRATETMGGELQFESKVGEGTTFTVTLPRRAEAG